VVKTFDQEIKKVEDRVEGKTIEKLTIREGLPYDPVAATPAVDLWSFGTILYFLCARFPLFKVNVNDDLVDGDAMERLWKWDDEQKEEALSAIEDYHARTLLSRLLSKDPEDRGTVADLMEDPFFNPIHDDTNSSVLDRIDAVEISLHDKMDSVRTAVIQAIFEANEVTHPTTFVILKEPLPGKPQPTETDDVVAVEPIKETIIELIEGIPTAESEPICDESETQQQQQQQNTDYDQLEEVCDWLDCLGQMTQAISKKVPDTFFASVKRRFNSLVQDENKTMYLYLIDELTGEPAIGPGYPIKITQPSKTVPRLLPYLQHSVKLLSLYNGVAFVTAFCPIPITLPAIPKETMQRLNNSVNSICAEVGNESSISEWKVLQDTVDDLNTSFSEIGDDTESARSESVRGASLRELGGFFDQHDPQRSFAGLRRIPGNDGVALWTQVPEADQQALLERRHANLLRVAQDRDTAIADQKKELQTTIDASEKKRIMMIEEFEIEHGKQQDEIRSRIREKEAQIQRMELEIRELKKAGGCACVIS